VVEPPPRGMADDIAFGPNGQVVWTAISAGTVYTGGARARSRCWPRTCRAPTRWCSARTAGSSWARCSPATRCGSSTRPA
jgi:hypothetical protein